MISYARSSPPILSLSSSAYPEKVEFEQRGTPAVEEVEVECAVRGIYPQPKIAVTWSDRCESNNELASAI